MAPRTGIEPVSAGRQPARIPDAQRGSLARRGGIEPPAVGFGIQPAPSARRTNVDVVAPGAGIEPAICRLTVGRRSTWLPWNRVCGARIATPGARTRAFSIVKELLRHWLGRGDSNPRLLIQSQLSWPLDDSRKDIAVRRNTRASAHFACRLRRLSKTQWIRWASNPHPPG